MENLFFLPRREYRIQTFFTSFDSFFAWPFNMRGRKEILKIVWKTSQEKKIRYFRICRGQQVLRLYEPVSVIREIV